MESRNTRLGYQLFFVYLLLYGGFVLLAAFSPETMGKLFGGLNLAVIYGFVLIVVAVALALVYGVLCKTDAEEDAQPSSEKTEAVQ